MLMDKLVTKSSKGKIILQIKSLSDFFLSVTIGF